MIIALDYDDTFTADRAMWSSFVGLAIAAGHLVTFVTYRALDRNEGNDDIRRDASALGIPVVYSEGRQKQDVFTADVWIDDSPELIPMASRRPVRRASRNARRSVTVVGV